MAADDFASPKRILDARHLRPRKRFGQNFLTDPRVAQRIAEALPPSAFVMEIGGGTGTLTAALAQSARHVIAIELDRDLAAVLSERFVDAADRVHVVADDVLHYDMTEGLRSAAPPRAICGNLPYYITTPILERVLAATHSWECAVFMVQREYARRLSARPGTAAYGSLTLFAGHFVHVEKLFDVGAAGFYPAPDVASTVIRLTPKPPHPKSVEDEDLLLWLIRAAFGHRRKTLVNSVLERIPGDALHMRQSVAAAVARAGLAPMVRAERLALADFYTLADILKEQGFTETLWTTRQRRNA